MGPIRGRQDPGGPHVGPRNLAIWDARWRRVRWQVCVTQQTITEKWQWCDICDVCICPITGRKLTWSVGLCFQHKTPWKHASGWLVISQQLWLQYVKHYVRITLITPWYIANTYKQRSVIYLCHSQLKLHQLRVIPSLAKQVNFCSLSWQFNGFIYICLNYLINLYRVTYELYNHKIM